MDLESECSVLDSVEDNEVIKNISGPDKLGSDIESKDQNNGSYVVVNNDTSKLEVSPSPVIKGNGTEVSEFSNSNHVETKLGASSSPTTVRRGQGLRKWRRIRRDLSKGGDSDINIGKVLSLERANSGVGSSKRQVHAERYQKAEGSSSTNAVVRYFDENALVGDIGPLFAAGSDSENSEDRSSKSSTAASAPKIKHERAAVVGSASHGKVTTRTSSGKNLTHSVQRGHQGKGRTEITKKARGDRVKIEKENSYSSLESDLRSSNFVFMQGKHFTSNGIQSERPIDYDYDVHGNGGGYGRDGDRGYEDVSSKGVVADSSWVKEEITNGHSSSTDQDPLFDSTFALQSVQESLEREVLKFKEISKDIEHTSEVVENSFKAAQSEVVETANRNVERELEDFFKKKIKAEVEYLVVSRMVQTMRTNFVDKLTLLEEQKALASEQTQMLNKLGDTENKAAMLKKEVEKLENICEDIANVDETLKLQNSVCKYTSCFFVQLLVLVVIIGVFISKLPPSSVEIVPT